MSLRRLFALASLLLLSGCLYHAAEHTDEAVCALTAHPFDLAPTEAAPALSKSPDKTGAAAPVPATDVRTAALMEAADEPQPKIERPPVKIPPEVPSADTPLVPNFNKLPKDEQLAAIRRLYPPLPPLTDEPTALPGPGGKPYALAELQQRAAGNSPTLREAAAGVQAAQGALEAAAAYPNPTLSYLATLSSDGSTPGAQGFMIDQTIKTGGKLKLQAAAAQKALDNAKLNLQLARSGLATQVRSAYFGLLVAKETVRVTKAMAHFTDEVYLYQEDLLEHGFAASYDPAILRAQAWTARLAYDQAVQSYIYAWEQLVAAVGLRQPLYPRSPGALTPSSPSTTTTRSRPTSCSIIRKSSSPATASTWPSTTSSWRRSPPGPRTSISSSALRRTSPSRPSRSPRARRWACRSPFGIRTRATSDPRRPRWCRPWRSRIASR